VISLISTGEVTLSGLKKKVLSDFPFSGEVTLSDLKMKG
jgi:hypothetical protein